MPEMRGRQQQLPTATITIMPNTTSQNLADSVFITSAGLTPRVAIIKPKVSHHCGLLRAYLDTSARIKPALGRLLQEVRCATLLLHENRLARFAYLKRLSATLPQITQTGELIVKVTLHGKIPPFSRAYRAN